MREIEAVRLLSTFWEPRGLSGVEGWLNWSEGSGVPTTGAMCRKTTP